MKGVNEKRGGMKGGDEWKEVMKEWREWMKGGERWKQGMDERR